MCSWRKAVPEKSRKYQETQGLMDLLIFADDMTLYMALALEMKALFSKAAVVVTTKEVAHSQVPPCDLFSPNSKPFLRKSVNTLFFSGVTSGGFAAQSHLTVFFLSDREMMSFF